MSGLALRAGQALNEHRCRRCGITIVAAYPICAACSATVRRFNEARAILAQSDADRRRPFPPARPRVPWE